jgi:hypothetical protein
MVQIQNSGNFFFFLTKMMENFMNKNCSKYGSYFNDAKHESGLSRVMVSLDDEEMS